MFMAVLRSRRLMPVRSHRIPMTFAFIEAGSGSSLSAAASTAGHDAA
jgi:hypothetical protein